MKLITEQNENIIVEATTQDVGGKKSYFIKGVFLQANIQNRNGRVYPMDILEREVARYHQSYVSQSRALGELGHPDGPTLNLDKVSHLIKELYRDGNNFIGKAEILDTPNGKIVKNLMDAGVKLGVSSRGMGSLKENGNGIQEVQVSTRRAGRCDPLALRRHFGPPTTCTRTRTRASCHLHAGAQQGASSPSAGPFGLSSHGMPLCVQRSHGRFSEHFRFLRTQDRQATTTGGFLYFSMGAEGGEVGTNGGVVPGGARGPDQFHTVYPNTILCQQMCTLLRV